MSREVMQMALDTFNKSKRSHYYCEDRFYSCPKHEEGCADALESDECNCGADTVNKSIDAAIEALRTALAQPDVPESCFGETKPVAMKFQIYKQTPPRGRGLEPINSALLPWVYEQDPSSGNTASMWVTPVATLPSKKEWVGLTDEEIAEGIINSWVIGQAFESAVWWAEEKLKEKNT